MKPSNNYEKISLEDLPDGLRFDVPGVNAGQIIEVAYGDRAEYRSENARGAPYKRVLDRSDNTVEYFRRVGPAFVKV